jgi:hypothetical protein
MSNENSLHEDISYMRQLAESGRKGPILGGVFLAAAGIVFGVACAISWAVRTGVMPVKGWNELYLWLGAFGVFALFWVFAFLRLMSRGPRAATAPNATFGTIWTASGFGVMVVFCTTLVVANRLNAPVVLNAYIPAIFAFYGTAWFASAALGKRTWMYVAGVGSFLFAFVMALLSENPLQVLAMGVGLILLLTLPGLKLMSSETRP